MRTIITILLTTLTLLAVLVPPFYWPEIFLREAYADLAAVICAGVLAIRLFKYHLFKRT